MSRINCVGGAHCKCALVRSSGAEYGQAKLTTGVLLGQQHCLSVGFMLVHHFSEEGNFRSAQKKQLINPCNLSGGPR